jgi:hypothetical protein
MRLGASVAAPFIAAAAVGLLVAAGIAMVAGESVWLVGVSAAGLVVAGAGGYPIGRTLARSGWGELWMAVTFGGGSVLWAAGIGLAVAQHSEASLASLLAAGGAVLLAAWWSTAVAAAVASLRVGQQDTTGVAVAMYLLSGGVVLVVETVLTSLLIGQRVGVVAVAAVVTGAIGTAVGGWLCGRIRQTEY